MDPTENKRHIETFSSSVLNKIASGIQQLLQFLTSCSFMKLKLVMEAAELGNPLKYGQKVSHVSTWRYVAEVA